MTKIKVIVILLSSVVFFLMGCGAGKNKTNVEMVTAMMDQESFKSQDWDPDQKNLNSMRVPPENTVPRGYKPYAYKYNADQAEKDLKNPYKKDTTADYLNRGHELYKIYCSVCHGEKGDGKGLIAAKLMVPPPSLISDAVKGYKDGRIYHVIRDGQGMMKARDVPFPRRPQRTPLSTRNWGHQNVKLSRDFRRQS